MSDVKGGGRRTLLKSSVAVGAALFVALGVSSMASAAEKEVNFSGWSAAVDLVESHIQAFEKNSGIKVNYSNYPWGQYRDTMTTRFVGDAPLDVLWVSDSWLPEWVEAGWLVPIDEFENLTKYNAETDDFCIKSASYKGKQYGLTYYTDYMAFFYNEDLLKQAGITEPPKTWTEVVEQSLKIKKAGVSKYPVMLALANETWLIEFISAMVFSHGGRFVDDQGDPVMNEQDQGAVNALQWIVDAVNKHGIVSPAAVETGELTGLKAFAAGNHAFALEPKYRLRVLNDPGQSRVAGNIKQTLMPAGSDGSHATVGWMRFYGMTPRAKKDPQRAEATAKFIEWFGGRAEGEYRFQKMMLTDIGTGFCTRPLFEDPDVRAAIAQYGDVDIIAEQQGLARKKDVISPWFGEWNEFNGAQWQIAVMQRSTVKEALEKSSELWMELKEEFN